MGWPSHVFEWYSPCKRTDTPGMLISTLLVVRRFKS